MATRKWLLGASGAVLMAGMAASSAHANLTFDLRLTDAAGNVLADPKNLTTGAGDVYLNLYAQVASANDATRAFQSAIGSFVTGGAAATSGSISGNGETVFTFFGSNPVQTSTTKYPSAAGFLGGGSQQGASASIAPNGQGTGPDAINDLGSANTANIDNYVVIRASSPNFTGTAIAGGEEWLIGKVKLNLASIASGAVSTINWLPRLNGSNATTEETALWYEDAQAGNASGARTGTTGTLSPGTPVTITGGGGVNQWNIDANGAWETPTPNWSAGVLPDGGAASFLGKITAPRTVTLASDHSVTSLNFDNANKYTLSGAGKLTVNGPISVVTGSHQVGRLGLAANSAISTANGQSLTAQSISGGFTLAANSTLKIAETANPTVTPSPNSSTSVLTALNLSGTSTAPTSQFDIANSKVVLSGMGADLNRIHDLIVAGRGGAGVGAATWNAKGISSKSAADVITNTGNEDYAIGYALNDDLPSPFATFGGATVPANSIVMRFTKMADADLNGKVDDDDVSQIGLFYDAGTSTGHHWYQGDFDGNGKIDDDDVGQLGLYYDGGASVLLIQSLEAKYGSSFAAAFAEGAAQAVPEPATLSLLGFGAVGLLGRRRRR